LDDRLKGLPGLCSQEPPGFWPGALRSVQGFRLPLLRERGSRPILTLFRKRYTPVYVMR